MLHMVRHCMLVHVGLTMHAYRCAGMIATTSLPLGLKSPGIEATLSSTFHDVHTQHVIAALRMGICSYQRDC